MKLHFNSISELSTPGKKWQKLYNAYWPDYKIWLKSKRSSTFPSLKASQAALKQYMPEMVSNYERFCVLADAGKLSARFLTGFQPPPYISACSQAIATGKKIQLVRNYDYHPDLIEGTLLMSAWNGKKVIANSDCLIGALDGMNEDGLVISLTFGGRKVVGRGFGIPFILRYVLEFCSNVEEAVAALKRIPSHMSYNVTVIDKSGAYKTVLLSPDKGAVVTDVQFTTNHQETIDWPENALFNKTVERSNFLKKWLADKKLKAANMEEAFLRPPLYNSRFAEGFGTLYTASYQPKEGTMQMLWPNNSVRQSFDHFIEMDKVIKFQQKKKKASATSDSSRNQIPATAPSWLGENGNKKKSSKPEWRRAIADPLGSAAIRPSATMKNKEGKKADESMTDRGKISWEKLTEYWMKFGEKYWKK